jgi:hypothetical protein
MELFNLCQLRYFYEYILKRRGGASIAAEIGTAVHSVAEVLGDIKKMHQEDDLGIVLSDIGTFKPSDYVDWLKPHELSVTTIDEINKRRKIKKFYTYKQLLQYGHVREGSEFIEHLIELACKRYLDPLDATDLDKARVRNYTWMLLEQFDVRRKDIVETEFAFDIALEEKWAENDGEQVKMIGYIDLVHREDGILEITDYKTGQRKDFLTGKVKEYKDIEKDIQLHMYHLALSHYFDEDIMANLIFVRDGGVFTITFPDGSLELTKQVIKKHLIQVRNAEYLRLLDPTRRDWRCRYFCPASKNCSFGNECDCKFLQSYIGKYGQDAAEKEFKKTDK